MADHDPYYALLALAARTPTRYKVCMVCGNIAEQEVDDCPYCSAYRFETDPEYVSNTALDQATHARTAVTCPSAFADE